MDNHTWGPVFCLHELICWWRLKHHKYFLKTKQLKEKNILKVSQLHLIWKWMDGWTLAWRLVSLVIFPPCWISLQIVVKSFPWGLMNRGTLQRVARRVGLTPHITLFCSNGLKQSPGLSFQTLWTETVVEITNPALAKWSLNVKSVPADTPRRFCSIQTFQRSGASFTVRKRCVRSVMNPETSRSVSSYKLEQKCVKWNIFRELCQISLRGPLAKWSRASENTVPPCVCALTAFCVNGWAVGAREYA